MTYQAAMTILYGFLLFNFLALAFTLAAGFETKKKKPQQPRAVIALIRKKG
jgi:hypothetical protein